MGGCACKWAGREARSEERNGVRELDTGLGKGIPGRGNSRCRGPEARSLSGGFEKK